MGGIGPCRDCGYGLLRDPADGVYVAEDDTACCAGRGEWGETLPHRPEWSEGDNGVRFYFGPASFPALPWDR